MAADIVQSIGAGAEVFGGAMAIASYVRAGRAERAEHFTRMLTELTGYSPQELGERLEGVENLQELVATAMDAASRSTDERKRRLLARAAAVGILGDESVRVDDRVLFVRTLDGVDVPHMKLLVLLTGTKRTVQNIVVTGCWSNDEIVERWPGVAESLDPLLAVLENQALVRGASSGNVFGGSELWNLTNYGARFVDFVRAGEPTIRPD